MIRLRLKSMSFLPHRQVKKDVEYKHTFVPEALSGRGIVGYLVKTILDNATAKNVRVKPTCSYVKPFIDKRLKYQVNSVFHGAKA